MSTFNQVVLIGNLGQNPDVLKDSALGCFVKLSVATHRKFKNKKGEVVKDTQWHTVYLNNNLGRLAATILKKGEKIFIAGELRTRDWQDKNGHTHRSTSIYAREIKFLSMKRHDQEELPESVEECGAYQRAKHEIDEALGRLSDMSVA
jgi:single-strand DNA-binding protein